MAMFGFPHWQLKSTSTESGVVAPYERLPFAQTAVMGVQHAVAMFGATVLMPILMGLDPNLSILMSGIGTLLFFLFPFLCRGSARYCFSLLPAGACPVISVPARLLSAW